ncbi:hypothetical protein Pcinc_025185 [Petrolisthes cinctipes]|uniref:Uncharacterized protein n=1 Tax=Petrolisthes cinctipes TaxID=88211 RepID=A0AAE1F9N9_PETCI|nr:hypothetical protein Pcinc_025185 [Petrolisthes cinctipes]
MVVRSQAKYRGRRANDSTSPTIHLLLPSSSHKELEYCSDVPRLSTAVTYTSSLYHFGTGLTPGCNNVLVPSSEKLHLTTPTFYSTCLLRTISADYLMW